MKNRIIAKGLWTLALLGLPYRPLAAAGVPALKVFERVQAKVDAEFARSGIPGLTLVMVRGDSVSLRSWGYADRERRVPVTAHTLFELGSTSKAFTALAVLKLEGEGLVGLDEPVSAYLPWFRSFYGGRPVQITLRQLLRHTSGIPEETISGIPEGDGDGMLDRTVRGVSGLTLKHLPGQAFEYATVNYDILGLVVERVSRLPFEEYLRRDIFQPLGMGSTSVGRPAHGEVATGYKVSFFAPRAYAAPRFRGNGPAGYVISSGEDMAAWIRHQLTLGVGAYGSLIRKSHEPDLTVSPGGASPYAYGWFVSPYGSACIFHSGMNPNYSSFVGLLPDQGLGFAVLANSNSDYTAYLGSVALTLLRGNDASEIPAPENGLDKVFSLVSILLSILALGILALLLWVVAEVVRGERTLPHLRPWALLSLLGGGLLTVPFMLAIYLLPKALMGFTWASTLVWAPGSLYAGSLLFIGVVVGTWLLGAASVVAPSRSHHRQSLPLIIMLSVLSGLANMALILILINAIGGDAKIAYLLYYFAVLLAFYIASRKYAQTRLTRISMGIVHELRMRLIRKIFLSSYQKFERIDNGRVYATLNQDTAAISGSVNVFIGLLSNVITIIGVFIYLGTISGMATLLVLSVIAGVAVLYYLVSRSTNALFEQARDASSAFSALVDGLLYGFKELSLSGLKKREYTQEVEGSCAELRDKSSSALVRFVNAFLVGETLLILVLGTVSFAMPFLFPEIPDSRLLGFIMIVLYLIGPINGVLGAIPNLLQIRVSWRRINGFIEEIEPDLRPSDLLGAKRAGGALDSLSASGVVFEYPGREDDSRFRVGPIDLKLRRGEILFIIGGNGSGKTTLANLLTGLYRADEGFVSVNGERVQSGELGEYYSAVFSNHHIFRRLYGVDSEGKRAELEALLRLLHMEGKVDVRDGQFTSVGLSNGQRKRLSLMKCFLEDSPVYLFDEWAADQDPEYKRIFYRQLLPEMRRSGKIVIAITHDDNYFDVADRIVKMDMGRMVEYSSAGAGVSTTQG